jgi:hypothetical protein
LRLKLEEQLDGLRQKLKEQTAKSEFGEESGARSV